MGLDGFSMSNLGLHRNLTTAQLANEVEATAKMALENQLPDVDGIGKKEKAGKKDPEAAFNPTVPFIPDKKKNDGEEEQQKQADCQYGQVQKGIVLEGQQQNQHQDGQRFDGRVYAGHRPFFCVNGFHGLPPRFEISGF